MSRLLAQLGLVVLLALTETPVMAEDRTTSVTGDDPEMTAVIDNARSTIKQFFDAFMNPKKGQTSFLLKVAFVSDDQTEHIWLADLDFSGPTPQGVVANEPRIKGLRFKQTVDFDPAYVT